MNVFTSVDPKNFLLVRYLADEVLKPSEVGEFRWSVLVIFLRRKKLRDRKPRIIE